MIDQQERYYNILKLNRWFAISSIIFVAIWIIVFVDDYQRSWKKYQQEFRNIEIERFNDELAVIDSELASNEEYNTLQEGLLAAESKLEAKTDEINELNQKIKNADVRRYKIIQNYQFAKAEFDVVKYTVDQAQHGHGDLEAAENNFQRLYELTSELKLELEGVEENMEGLQNQLTTLYADQKSFNNEINVISRKRDRTVRKLTKIDPSKMTFANKIGNIVRDLPVLDFMDPYYEVKQVVVNDIEEDLVYLGMPKVDRCMTCHVGIDTKGYENAPQPYTTHPRLEEFVGSKSAHPMSDYGCTVCHAGRGRGVDFNSSAHMPQNETQGQEWHNKYDWEALHHWDNLMLPMQYVEASCYKCHSGSMPVKGAPELSLGLAIVEKGGCFGCHQIDRWEETPKPGPDLQKIAEKTSKEFTYKWILAPRDYRYDTWMPHFFGQPNNNDAESLARTDQEILSMVQYLFDNSETYDMDRIPLAGDTGNGEMLINSLGCLGCHRMEEDPNSNGKPSFDEMHRQQGPNLIYAGSKTNQQWIYNWIRSPQSYHPGTKMPDLRLTKQEAADISAYLISSNNDEFDAQNIPQVNTNELDKIVISFMEQTKRKDEVDAELKAMDDNQKLNYAGEKLIRQYGCYGCHDIKGFENAKPIGTPLTYEGSMLITKLDFAFMHDEINHTKWDWFRLKLDNPRMYDMIPQGDDTYTMRVKRPLEKLRMPHFGLNEKELDAIVTVIMGFVKDEIPPTKLPPKTTSNLIVEEGQRLLQTYNCKGCHSIDGEGGAIIPTVASWLGEISDETSAEDASLVQSFAPPLLNTEGRKVQPEWLFNFMKKPTMIRPNLQVRMPTYNMITDNELNKIIKYFQYKDNQMLAYEKPHTINKNSDSYKAGEVIQELGACNNCHFYGKQKPKQAALTWAPNLALAKDRFRQDWLLEFFANPQDVMSGTKMPAPYIPTDEPQADVLANWGKSVANMNGDSTKLYQGLIDYIWGIKGQHDISKIVKKHLESEDYGFIIEDEEDDWGDDDW